MRLRSTIVLIALAASAMIDAANGQQLADPRADVSVQHPAFSMGLGPRVAIDSAHHNFHTASGLFAPFAAVLRNDGFRVAASSQALTPQALADVDVLIIANALNAANVDKWELPTPSAFTSSEIVALRNWVGKGGSLLLIADHLPFAGAAADLAAAFGFSFVNGFALNAAATTDSDTFSIDAGTLPRDAILRGREPDEAVTSVVTFTGSAFKAPGTARPLLALSSHFVLLLPKVAWKFDDTTPKFSGAGWLQGAVLPFERGRVAVFGEAGMFTAQLVADKPAARIGFNAPEAQGNKQFVLNVMHWLANAFP